MADSRKEHPDSGIEERVRKAGSLWLVVDSLRREAAELREEADFIDRWVEQLDCIAAAVSDGRPIVPELRRG